MTIVRLALLALGIAGLCLGCGGEEAAPTQSSARARVAQETPSTTPPEPAIRKLAPRKAEAREAVEARLSRAERRLKRLREGEEPLAPEVLGELERARASARETLDDMQDVRGADWDGLLVEAERAVEELERGLDRQR